MDILEALLASGLTVHTFDETGIHTYTPDAAHADSAQPKEPSMSQLPIVGARYRPPADTILANLPAGQPLILVREPDNQYDPNAVKVCLPEGWLNKMQTHHYTQLTDALALAGQGVPSDEEFHLGYVPKELAERIAPAMDENPGPVDCVLGFDMTGRPVAEQPGVDEPDAKPLKEALEESLDEDEEDEGEEIGEEDTFTHEELNE